MEQGKLGGEWCAMDLKLSLNKAKRTGVAFFAGTVKSNTFTSKYGVSQN